MNISPAFFKASLVALFCAATASAQQVVTPLPEPTLVAPPLRVPSPTDVQSSSGFEAFPTGSSIAVGRFQLHPHLATSLVIADGLPVQAGVRVKSNIFSFAPGLSADLGERLTFDYTPTWTRYSAEEMNDSTSHSVRLTAANQSPDWRIQLTESYSTSSSILVETAQQTKQKSWANSVSVSHDFGNLLHYQGTGSFTKSDTENYSTINDWETQHWVRATVSPRVNAGLGLALGYSDIINAPDSNFEKYLGELSWRATDKVNLSLQGGWENRHSSSTAIGSSGNPIIQATLGWQPFAQTRISVSDSRTVANAVGGTSVVTSETWGVTLDQRLLEKLSLHLGYNDGSSDYEARASDPLAGRSDQVKSFNASLSTTLFKHWALAATYQTSKNDGNQADYRYSSTQYGLQLSGSF